MATTNDTTYTSIPERATESTIMILIILVALIGNISFWILCLRDGLLRRHLSTWLMLCLSMADILVSMINMPTVVISIVKQRWIYSEGVCIALGFICMVTFIASVMSLASISLYRYALACHITKVKVLYTNKNTIYIISGTWLFSIILSIPPLLGWGQYGYLPNQSICFCKWKSSVSYTYFMICVCFWGPCLVMTYCYVMILKRIRSVKARLLMAGNRSSKAGFDESTLSYSTSERDVTKSGESGKSRKNAAIKMADEPSGSSGSKDGRLVKETDNEVSPAKSNVTISTLDISGEELQTNMFLDDDKIEAPGERNANGAASVTNHDTTGSLGSNQVAITLTRCPNNIENNEANERERPSPKSLNVPERPGSAVIKRRAEKLSRFQANTRLTVSFFVVILTFVICWLPFCITMLLSVHTDYELPRIPIMATLILGCLNSCCNPIIYGVMNTKYRPGFVALLCRQSNANR